MQIQQQQSKNPRIAACLGYIHVVFPTFMLGVIPGYDKWLFVPVLMACLMWPTFKLAKARTLVLASLLLAATYGYCIRAFSRFVQNGFTDEFAWWLVPFFGFAIGAVTYIYFRGPDLDDEGRP